jgi:hypothetical protein
MTWLRKRRLPILIVILVVLFLGKCFWSLFLFPEVPFGYDAGIYRYLFVRFAQAFPPFIFVWMPGWSNEHPLGLFFFSTILLRAGVPVDWLIGWIWNLFPLMLSGILSWTVARSYGRNAGVSVLLLSLLSVAQYEGFLMMYWKVFVALLWCTLAFGAMERKSRLWPVFGMLAIATHQQIGLIFALSSASSIVIDAIHRPSVRKTVAASLLWILTCVLGLLWYLPNHTQAIDAIVPQLLRPAVLVVLLVAVLLCLALVSAAVFLPLRRRSVLRIGVIFIFVGVLVFFEYMSPLITLVQGAGSVPGAFMSVTHYTRLSFPLIFLGVAGLLLLLRRAPASPWLWATAWSGLAVISLFFFYRRFLLPLDFFFLPGSALVLSSVWESKDRVLRRMVIALLLVQAVLLLRHLSTIDPHVNPSILRDLPKLSTVVPQGSTVLVLDNMAPWVIGFLPDAVVSGPGIFEYPQPIDAWEKFLFGSHEDRIVFLQQYPLGTYLYATEVFRTFYPPEVQTLFADPCLEPTRLTGLFRSVCGPQPR